MNYDESLYRQELYSTLCLLGANVNHISSMNPTTQQLKDLVSGLVSLMIMSNAPDIEGLKRIWEMMESFNNANSL